MELPVTLYPLSVVLSVQLLTKGIVCLKAPYFFNFITICLNDAHLQAMTTRTSCLGKCCSVFPIIFIIVCFQGFPYYVTVKTTLYVLTQSIPSRTFNLAEGNFFVSMALHKAFYNYKPCCDKKSNTVGSLILGETESTIRAKHNIDQRHLL